jgi:S1-C subfamily serine protease
MTPNNALTIAVASLVLAVLGAALLGVSGAAISLTVPLHFSPQGEASAAAARPVIQPLGSRTAPDYRAIVAQNKPAVVGITSESTVPVEPPFGPPLEEGPFMWGTPENDPFFPNTSRTPRRLRFAPALRRYSAGFFVSYANSRQKLRQATVRPFVSARAVSASESYDLSAGCPCKRTLSEISRNSSRSAHHAQ